MLRFVNVCKTKIESDHTLVSFQFALLQRTPRFFDLSAKYVDLQQLGDAYRLTFNLTKYPDAKKPPMEKPPLELLE